MKILLTPLFSLFLFTVFAQKSDKKIKEVKDDFFVSSYTINKKSKIKDGEYFKIKRSPYDTLVTGYYNNDQKSGLWRFWSTGDKDYISYNYDTRTIEYLSPEISKIDSFYTITDGNGLYLLNKVDSPPIYLGYKGEIKKMLSNEVKIPLDEMANGLKGVSASSFVIDRTGKIKDIKIDRPLSNSFDRMLKKVLEKIDGDWIPARINNSPTDAKMFVLIHVYNSKMSGRTKDKPYLIAIDIAYYGVTRTETRSSIISVPAGSRPGF